EPPTKKNTWLRNAKCFILESVPTTNTLVLHLKSESKGVLKRGVLKHSDKSKCRLYPHSATHCPPLPPYGRDSRKKYKSEQTITGSDNNKFKK
ncbi:TPA: hypothetical protein ACTCYI_001552, partial [Neisseria meningitidis]